MCLSGMALADFSQATSEIINRVTLVGDRPQVDKKTNGPVIAQGVAPHDFGLDLSPDILAALRNRIEPCAA
jgi:hypothetical protein